MKRLGFISALGAWALLCVANVGADVDPWLAFGMKKSVLAYDAVCWYENLKTFPNTNTDAFTKKCQGQAKFQMTQIETMDFFNQNPEQREPSFGQFMQNYPMGGIPSVYGEQCNQYLQDSKANPPADFSEVLRDDKQVYPYRAFAYCLMKTLKDTQGDKAIEAVKNDYKRKHWRQVLLDRDNEFRKRHGQEPFILATDLMNAAQAWAQENADSCKSHHSTDASRTFQGQATGESISAGQEPVDIDDSSALVASDGWYEEIRNYPYPNGYQGNNNDKLFYSIGHFTQSVWKGSQYVGYGLAHNPKCKGMTRFIVARYYPAGNMQGDYPNNVAPPSDS